MTMCITSAAIFYWSYSILQSINLILKMSGNITIKNIMKIGKPGIEIFLTTTHPSGKLRFLRCNPYLKFRYIFIYSCLCIICMGVNTRCSSSYISFSGSKCFIPTSSFSIKPLIPSFFPLSDMSRKINGLNWSCDIWTR